MPMDFPNMDCLKRTAKIHQFRQPNESESEQDYRELLANHVMPRDRIESFEIRFSVGWDKWTTEQKGLSLGM